MSFVETVATPPARPVLFFDGECGFCRFWVRRWKACTGDRVAYEPFQEALGRFPEITLEDFRKAIQFVETDGRRTRGAEAAFRVIAYQNGRQWLLWFYENVPVFAPVSELFYSLVAKNRRSFSWVTRLLWGPEVRPSTYQWTRWIFLRALAAIYLVAFASLWPQIMGLFGEQGIIPTRLLMDSVRQQVSGHWIAFPTLAWLQTSDLFLRLLCGGGMVLSLAALMGFLSPVVFFLLWVFYLSIVGIGVDFLSFQWDALLLETGFLAIFFAPLQWKEDPRQSSPTSGAILFLLRCLLLKLMVQSAIVKWMSGDPSWQHLTALQFYYETMPLPNPLSWFFHHRPDWFHQVSAGFVFFIEGLVAWWILFPRRARWVAFIGLAGLQILILLTGNYSYFNWLTLALCLLLLDDHVYQWFLPSRWHIQFETMDVPGMVLRFARAGLVILILSISSLKCVAMFGWHLPRWLQSEFALLEPFRSVNNYGLFAVMTTTRPEIVVEGSMDGNEWKAYEFKYKPQDLMRRPGIVAPYMPRLDWQMWFAALGDVRQNPWFLNFVLRLMQGSRPVLALLKTNPFPDKPPTYIRAQVYDYHFTSPEERQKTGAWWTRQYKGLYLQPITRR